MKGKAQVVLWIYRKIPAFKTLGIANSGMFFGILKDIIRTQSIKNIADTLRKNQQ